MIESILAAVDPSDHGTRVMDYALRIGQIFGSRILGLSVVESKKVEGPLLRDYLSTIGLDPGLDYTTKVETFYREKLRDLLDHFEERCHAAGLFYESRLEAGVVARRICAAGEDRDLVIMGKSGEHAEWSTGGLGGSVQFVARALKKPLLLTPRRRVAMDRALIAYDGSSCAASALELACEIAFRTNLQGTVLVVGEGDRSAREVQAARETVAARGAPFDVIVRPGEVAETVLATAAALSSELLVMGAYGHGRIRSLLLGSTTEEVIGKAKIPVLVRH